MITLTFYAATKVLATQCQAVTHTDCGDGLPHVDANKFTIHSVLQLVFAIVGALAVLMIVIAGMRFVTSSGSPQEVAKARNTIIYALVGLVIALTAEALVSFVLGKL